VSAPVGSEVRTTSGLTSYRTFHGYHVDASAAAVVEIRDGSAGGAVIATTRLAGAGKDGPYFIERGIATAGLVYVQIVSGTPTVTVYGR
jgi:hypothetical protein